MDNLFLKKENDYEQLKFWLMAKVKTGQSAQNIQFNIENKWFDWLADVDNDKENCNEANDDNVVNKHEDENDAVDEDDEDADDDKDKDNQNDKNEVDIENKRNANKWSMFERIWKVKANPLTRKKKMMMKCKMTLEFVFAWWSFVIWKARQTNMKKNKKKKKKVNW